MVITRAGGLCDDAEVNLRAIGPLAVVFCTLACSRKEIVPSGGRPAVVTARAPGRPDVRFIAVGDTGMGNDEQRQVARAIETTCAAEGCDFVLLLGDNLYLSGAASADDPQWRDKFEEPYRNLSMPFWAALGNHDYGHRGIGDDFGRPEGELAYARTGGKFRMPARRYSFTAGNALFVALDTNAARYGEDRGQAAEVAGWMATPARWKIAFGHHPILSNGPHGNAGNYDPDLRARERLYGPVVGPGGLLKTLFDDQICGKADLYLSGHDHSRQWLEQTCAGTELAVSGAGAEATDVTPRNPARFAKASLGYLHVVAGEQELRARFFDGDGKPEFERVLTKAAR